MNYQEAIEALKQNPEKSYVGILINQVNHCHFDFGFYEISFDPDFDVCISYEGGLIFDHDFGGEEDFYSLDDVPDLAKKLYYKCSDSFPDISDTLSEYSLFKLFPDLEDPENLWDEKDRRDFIHEAMFHVHFTWAGVDPGDCVVVPPLAGVHE